LTECCSLDKYSQFKAINTKVLNLRIEKARGNSKAEVKLLIFQIDYLFNIFIPFLESLNFQSKKKLDFNDFKLITTLIYQGKHLKPEIKNFILDVSYTMNNFRLSTFKNLAGLPETGVETIDLPAKTTSLSQLKISGAVAERYLNLPPVYVKTTDGRIINIETGDLIRDTFVIEVIKMNGTISLFSTVTDCALFFNISRSVIYTKLANGSSMESLSISKFNKIRVFNFCSPVPACAEGASHRPKIQ
jgi:hypothetical protein